SIPYLLPFPTRRSSDLPHHRQRLLEALGLPDKCTREKLADTLRQWRAIDVEDTVTAAQGIAVKVRNARQWQRSSQAKAAASVPRSEEHTSELQSRENLV